MRMIRTAIALIGMAALMLAFAGAATAKDRNKDRIPDRWEKRHGLSLKKKQGRRDQDRDGLKNRAEFRSKTDPRDSDSDDDGVDDGEEGAGRIASYDPGTGELVINLFGGKSVSGLVTDGTRIRCGCRGTEPEHEDEDDSDDDSTLRHGDGDGSKDDDDDDHSGSDDDDDHSGSRDDDDDDDDHSGPGGGGSHDRDCSTDELVEGAVVSEAELELTANGLVFDEVELVKKNPDGEPNRG